MKKNIVVLAFIIATILSIVAVCIIINKKNIDNQNNLSIIDSTTISGIGNLDNISMKAIGNAPIDIMENSGM
jgi:uncharacterized membrane protein